MIKGVIKNYNDAKLAIINSMSDTEENIFPETEFLDDATISYRINKLKEEFKRISREIEILIAYDKKDQYNSNKVRVKANEKNKINYKIAFLASNNFKNLDSCEELLKGVESDFKLCIDGLKYYKSGDNKRAFESFYSYFRDKDYILDHYLINKVYGEILFEHRQYDTALILLRKAIEKKPEDIELHDLVEKIYLERAMEEERKIELDIINILEAKYD